MSFLAMNKSYYLVSIGKSKGLEVKATGIFFKSVNIRNRKVFIPTSILAKNKTFLIFKGGLI